MDWGFWARACGLGVWTGPGRPGPPTRNPTPFQPPKPRAPPPQPLRPPPATPLSPQVGQRYGLPLLSPVDDAGRFTEEAGPQFAGLAVQAEGNAAVISELGGKGALLMEESYEHKWAGFRGLFETLFLGIFLAEGEAAFYSVVALPLPKHPIKLSVFR